VSKWNNLVIVAGNYDAIQPTIHYGGQFNLGDHSKPFFLKLYLLHTNCSRRAHKELAKTNKLNLGLILLRLFNCDNESYLQNLRILRHMFSIHMDVQNMLYRTCMLGAVYHHPHFKRHITLERKAHFYMHH